MTYTVGQAPYGRRMGPPRAIGRLLMAALAPLAVIITRLDLRGVGRAIAPIRTPVPAHKLAGAGVLNTLMVRIKAVSPSGELEARLARVP